MSNATRSVGVMAVCVLLICAGAAVAQDWPQWRGANRDGKAAGFAAPATWPKALTQKWKADVGAGDATPALVGERLYVFARQGGDEVTVCLDAATGKELWKDKYAAQAVTGPAAKHPGPRGSPAVADGKVVTLGVGGVVSCLDAASGKMLWRKDPFPKVVPRFFAASSPLIVDGLAIAQVGGQGQGAIIAFDLAGGQEKWKADGLAPEYASPVLMTAGGVRQVVAMTDKGVVGVAVADGKVLWQAPCPPAGRMSYNAATPIIDGQTVIVTGGGRAAIALKVEKTDEGFAAKEIWKGADAATQFNTPVLAGGMLFGLTNRGNLFCIDAATGKTGWTDATSHGRGFAAIVNAGSVILALPNDSELIAFKPQGKAFAQLARIKVADTGTYAHPVVAGNRIFVKDQDAVTLWTID